MIMRQVVAVALICLLAAFAHGQDKPSLTFEVEECTIDQYAITHGQPVSFSIGFPKGWRKNVERANVPVLCSFWSMPALPNGASIIIFRTSGTTAKENAERCAASALKRGYIQKDFGPIKTRAGDPGYLTVFEAIIGQDHKTLTLSDFFFHVGTAGAIRISISTAAEDSDLLIQLHRLVLETLRF
jgi:hypothetical protein